jgi:hypothetical protein
MTRQLVLIHGRSQEFRSAEAEKEEWLGALKAGLAKNGLTLPIPESDVRLPYYGQALYDLVKKDIPEDQVAEVIVRGDGAGEQEANFVRAALVELQHAKGITDEEVQAVANEQITERGPLNWKWVQAILRVLDINVPGASGASVALATRDVYLYLRNPGLQNVVDSGVRSAFTPGVETVVVSHSLGTVVSYSLLRREGASLGWKIPLHLTLGSPLGVKVIKDAMAPNKHPACVTKWFNAMDSRDVVALYPLDEAHFRLNPLIENKTDVDNPTENRHGITGYLSDAVVAKRIHDALVQ